MSETTTQLQRAITTLDEARGSLDRVLRAGLGGQDATWRQQHLAAMSAWAQAYRHYRTCHAEQRRVSLWTAM